MTKIWKAFLGIIFIGAGIISFIRDFNYWILLLGVLGLYLVYLDLEKLKKNDDHKQMILVSVVVIMMMVADSVLGIFF